MQIREIGKNETVGMLDALDYGERQGTTEFQEIKMKTAEGRIVTRERVRRKALDARLWGSMSGSEQSAAERIASAFKLITSGLGAKGQVFEKTYGRGSEDFAIELLNDYSSWIQQCKRAGIDVNMVLEIVVVGRSLSEVDRLFRQRKHTARANLFEGLEAFCVLKRWN